jgi:hypothetical protein
MRSTRATRVANADGDEAIAPRGNLHQSFCCLCSVPAFGSVLVAACCSTRLTCPFPLSNVRVEGVALVRGCGAMRGAVPNKCRDRRRSRRVRRSTGWSSTAKPKWRVAPPPAPPGRGGSASSTSPTAPGVSRSRSQLAHRRCHTDVTNCVTLSRTGDHWMLQTRTPESGP